jgi:hypothetical protein
MGLKYLSHYLFYITNITTFYLVFLQGLLNQLHKNQLISQLVESVDVLNAAPMAFCITVRTRACYGLTALNISTFFTLKTNVRNEFISA